MRRTLVFEKSLDRLEVLWELFMFRKVECVIQSQKSRVKKAQAPQQVCRELMSEVWRGTSSGFRTELGAELGQVGSELGQGRCVPDSTVETSGGENTEAARGINIYSVRHVGYQGA